MTFQFSVPCYTHEVIRLNSPGDKLEANTLLLALPLAIENLCKDPNVKTVISPALPGQKKVIALHFSRGSTND